MNNDSFRETLAASLAKVEKMKDDLTLTRGERFAARLLYNDLSARLQAGDAIRRRLLRGHTP